MSPSILWHLPDAADIAGERGRLDTRLKNDTHDPQMWGGQGILFEFSGISSTFGHWTPFFWGFDYTQLDMSAKSWTDHKLGGDTTGHQGQLNINLRICGRGEHMSSFSIRNRGSLPHWEDSEGTYFVTFRLAGSLPRALFLRWVEELKSLGDGARKEELLARTECYLDEGYGARHLANPKVAEVVSDALLFFDGQRYLLHAWCVMPNHVHAVFSIEPEYERSLLDSSPLASILQSWKSFTAKKANALLGRSGEFWQREYYDTLVRDELELQRVVEYTLFNPVKAGLCEHWEDWPWSGAQFLTPKSRPGSAK